MLLIAHELGADGSRFRRLVMNLDADARTALTTRLCALPLDEAVGEVAALLARLDARRRARAGRAGGRDEAFRDDGPRTTAAPRTTTTTTATRARHRHDAVGR